MTLWHKLNEIFKGTDIDRISSMQSVLNREEVYTPRDFEFLDEEILVSMNYFKPVEIKKILKAKEGAKSFKNTLEEIFGNRNPIKLEYMEKFYEGLEVYTAEHLTLFSLAKVDQRSDIFSDLDVEKIRNFIRKNYPERYKEIKEKEYQDENRP